MITFALLLLATQAGDSITLDQALERAERSRARVVIASASVARARGALRVAGAIPNPSLQLEFDDLSPTGKATVIQPLSWLVRRGADRDAGRAGVTRAVADSAQMIADLGRDVRRSFYGALAADALLRLVSEQTAIADSLAGLAGQRLASGDISALERDQVNQEAGRVRIVLSQTRETSRAARFQLARAVAWEGADPPAPRGPLDEGLRAPGNVPASTSRQDVQAMPLMRSAVADSSAAAARLRAARLGRIPIPGFVAGREWGAGSEENAIFGLALPIPLWSQGNETVAEARGAAMERAAMATETRLDLIARLEEAQVRLTESASRARLADSLLTAARDLRAGTVRLYESGRTGVLPVFEALRGERDVAQSLVRELLAFQDARADLRALLGLRE